MKASSVIRPALWVLLIAAGLALLAWSGWDLERLLARLPSPHPGWFFLAMALLPIAGFPIAFFYLYAGSVYGFVLGWLLCLPALAFGLTASYVIGRWLLREPLLAWLQRRGTPPPDISRLNQFRFTFLLRAIPGAPFPVQNYLLAVAGVPFGLYWIVSFLTQGALAAGMVAIGHYSTVPRTRIYVLIGLAMVGILVGLRTWLRRQARNRPSKPKPPK